MLPIYCPEVIVSFYHPICRKPVQDFFSQWYSCPYSVHIHTFDVHPTWIIYVQYRSIYCNHWQHLWPRNWGFGPWDFQLWWHPFGRMPGQGCLSRVPCVGQPYSILPLLPPGKESPLGTVDGVMGRWSRSKYLKEYHDSKKERIYKQIYIYTHDCNYMHLVICIRQWCVKNWGRGQ